MQCTFLLYTIPYIHKQLNDFTYLYVLGSFFFSTVTQFIFDVTVYALYGFAEILAFNGSSLFSIYCLYIAVGICHRPFLLYPQKPAHKPTIEYINAP